MRKYGAVLMTTIKNNKMYKMDLALKVVGAFILVIALRETWEAIYQSQSGLQASTGVSLKSMATYTIVSVMLQMVIDSDVAGEISNRVRSGEIASDFQKPWNFMLFHLARSMGSSVFGILYVVLPLVVASVLLFPLSFPKGLQGVWFLVSCMLGYFISYGLSFMLGLLAFLFTAIWGFEFVHRTIVQFCSGSFIPLWFFPERLLHVIQWLPFQGIFSIPLSILIGRLTGAQMMDSLLLQLGWVVALLVVGHFGLKYMVRLLITTGG